MATRHSPSSAVPARLGRFQWQFRRPLLSAGFPHRLARNRQHHAGLVPEVLEQESGRLSGWRGGSRTGGREAPRQARTIGGRARFLSQEVRNMSAPDRRGLLQRDHESLSIRRQCQLPSVARPRCRPVRRDRARMWSSGMSASQTSAGNC